MTRRAGHVLVMVTALAAGCGLYITPSSTHHHDAGRDAVPADAAPADAPVNACGQSIADEPACAHELDCGADHHCEVQCAPAGTDNCIYRCHSTCVQDECCSAVDCGAGKSCVMGCARDCQGMAQYCLETCVDDTMLGCDAITNESDCLARADCIPIYHGVDCTCSFAVCSCQSSMGAFARCESATP